MSGLAKRGGWAPALAALALAVGLAVPGAAQDSPADGVGRADNRARYSACVGEAYLEPGTSGPFLDVRGWNLEDEIFCVAHYGITEGRTPTAYSPTEPTLRWQMALFLYRAALPAGLVLPKPARDQDFTDIGGLSEEAWQAVNSLAEMGIMTGEDGLFSPNLPVTRSSMAQLMAAFLRVSTPGTGAFGPAARLEDIRPDATVFTDTDDLFAGAYRDIELIYELGITEGKTITTYAPEDPVTRGQMAAFITRMLSHTLARPVGVSVQVGDGQGAEVEVTASVRDVNYQPRRDVPVDMFWIGDPDSVYSSARTCPRGADEVGSGARLCEIDDDDDRTNAAGDVTVTISKDSAGKVWAWTGKKGDRVRSAPAGTLSGSQGVGSARVAAGLKISDSLVENQQKLKYGRSVTFTLQVVDEDGVPLDLKDIGIRISSTEIAPSGGTGSRIDVRTHRTDDRGQISLTYIQMDPNIGRPDGDAQLMITFYAETISQDLPLEDDTTNGLVVAGGRAEEAEVFWSDDEPEPVALELDQMVAHHPASAAGRGAANRVTATVIDQYGNRFSGVRRVFFDSDDSDGVGQAAAAGAGPLRRTTTRGGIATLDYERDSADSGVEIIRAWVDQQDGPRLDSNDLAHYWTKSPAGLEGRSAVGSLRLVDTEADQLVFDDNGREVWAASYDSNDRFIGRSGLGVSLADFENQLQEALGRRITVENYSDSPSGRSRFILR